MERTVYRSRAKVYNAHMAEKYDVIIIGAGILGCFAARSLTGYDLSVAVLEKREDVCTGITRANSGIIYRGYDQHPDSLKAQMCVRASQGFHELCRQLDVAYRQCSLLMLSFGPRAQAVLEKKMKHGMQLGIDRLHLIDCKEVYDLEPGLCPGVKSALYSEDTCVADPWELGIAAFENARENGARFFFDEEVLSISRDNNHFSVETGKAQYEAKRVLCCAGLNADTVWNMAAKPCFTIVPQAADYIVFDVIRKPYVRHIISVEPEEYGDGLTLTPTVSGNILAGPTRRDIRDPSEESGFETKESGIKELLDKTRRLFPDFPVHTMIRSFGALRPNPYDTAHPDKSIKDFLILEEQGFFSLAGVKTPGITCADELGRYICGRILASFPYQVPENRSYNPCRTGIRRVSELSDKIRAELVRTDPDYGKVVCRCRDITYAQIREAVRAGAATLDGIRRRTGAGMGRCQGAYCTEKILNILKEETGQDIYRICKNRPGSEILKGKEDPGCFR